MANRFNVQTTTPGDWTAAASWSATYGGSGGSGPLANTNDAFVSAGDISFTTNVTGNSGVSLNSLQIVGGVRGFRGGIGAVGSALDTTALDINIFEAMAPIYLGGTVADSGAAVIVIDGTLPGRKNGVVLSNQTGSATVDNVELRSGELEIASGFALTASTGREIRILGGRAYLNAISWPTSTNYSEVMIGGYDNAYCEMTNGPTNSASGSASRITINKGGHLVFYGSSAVPQFVINGTLDYRATVAPGGVSGGSAPSSYMFILKPGGTLILDDCPVDLSPTIDSWQGSTLSINTKGTALAFTQNKRGRGPKIISGTARSVTGLSGDTGGSSGVGA